MTLMHIIRLRYLARPTRTPINIGRTANAHINGPRPRTFASREAQPSTEGQLGLSSRMSGTMGHHANSVKPTCRPISRGYSTDPPSSSTNSGDENAPSPGEPIAPEMWLVKLEETVTAPWVAAENTPQDKATPEDRLRRAYLRTFTIFMYLGRPSADDEESAKRLVEFEQGDAVPGSELARARNAITALTHFVVRDLDTIPSSSPLRSKHTDIFGMLGALLPLRDMYLTSLSVTEAPQGVEWTQFWERAQPILLTLGMKLNDDGFGFSDEEQKK